MQQNANLISKLIEMGQIMKQMTKNKCHQRKRQRINTYNLPHCAIYYYYY